MKKTISRFDLKMRKIRTAARKFNLVVNNTDSTIPQPERVLELDKQHPFRLGKSEVEEAARLLVRFFAEKGDGSWRYFTFEDLAEFCREQREGNVGAALFGLICGWVDDGGVGSLREPWPYIIQLNGGYFAITDFFIKRLTIFSQ